jgi:hypothetical protein
MKKVISKNQEILELSREILEDIDSHVIPLASTLLKTSRLSSAIKDDKSVTYFQGIAKDAEHKKFIIDTFEINMQSTKDPNISYANPNQRVYNFGNKFERENLRKQAEMAMSVLAAYKTNCHSYALRVYERWSLGETAETIFELKRKKVEPILLKIFPDFNKRIESIENNLKSENPEDWKSSVASCRTLLMDIADIVNPPKEDSEKGKYINRLQDFISPKITSQTKKNLLKTFLEELKKRIEYTANATQGAAHKDRPILEEAQDIVLYTYFAIAEIMSRYEKTIDKLH